MKGDGTPPPARGGDLLPPRRSPLNPDNTLTIQPAVIEALRILIVGDDRDRSPSVRELKRVLHDTGCDEDDKDIVLYILDLHKEF